MLLLSKNQSKQINIKRIRGKCIMTLQGIFSQKILLISFPLHVNYFFLLARYIHINLSLLWQILSKHLQHFTPIFPWLIVWPLLFFRLHNYRFYSLLSFVRGPDLFVETFFFFPKKLWNKGNILIKKDTVWRKRET